MKKLFLFSVAISAALMTSAETLLIEGERTIADADFDTTLSGITEIALADKNAQLTFDLESDHEYSGTVSGSGKIVKSGNVSFGASGILNVVRTNPYQRNLTMTYDQVTGLDNLKNWTLQFNGKPAKSGCSVSVVDGQLQLNVPGLFILFK